MEQNTFSFETAVKAETTNFAARYSQSRETWRNGGKKQSVSQLVAQETGFWALRMEMTVQDGVSRPLRF